MSKIRLPPVGFWSYARQDDELSQGKLSSLRSLLMFELQQQYGRDTIHIFQDVSTIPHGSAWEQEIRGALDKTTFFIAIVTPNFIQSDWCCREVQVFLEREAELHRLYPDLPKRGRIFPIHFIDIEGVDPADPEVLEVLRSLQWFDFRRFRHRSYDSDVVREAISELAASMRELLQVKVEDPEAVRERQRRAEAEAARLRHEEEAKAAREREEEARRRREEAQVKAEAARKRAEEAAEAARKRAAEAAEAARLQAEEAAEAARILALEEAASERARLEAEEAARRLTADDVAAAERARAESEAAVERARVDSLAAEQALAEKAAAAERARSRSDALEARERLLAEQAVAAAEAPEEESHDGRGEPAWLQPPVAIAASAAALLAIVLLFFLVSSPEAPAVTPSDPADSVPASPPSEAAPAHAWLAGRWGLEGDCTVATTISVQPEQIWVDLEGQAHGQRVTEAGPERVVTDRARYRRSGDSVNVSEEAAEGRINYSMTRCEP